MEPTTLQGRGLEGKIYTRISDGTKHRVSNITYKIASVTPNPDGYPQMLKSITPPGSIGKPPRGKVKVQWEAMDPDQVTLINIDTDAEHTINYAIIVNISFYTEVIPPTKPTLAEKIATNFIDGDSIKGCHATIFNPTLSYQATRTGGKYLRDSLLHPHNHHKLDYIDWKREWIQNKYG